jgi:lysophospholipase L1-like esterase
MPRNLLHELFQGTLALEEKEGWIQPWRLPREDSPLFHSHLLERAVLPSGVRLRFSLRAPQVGLRCRPLPVNRLFDLTRAGEIVRTSVLPAGEEEVWFRGLGEEETVFEIWFPPANPVQVTDLILPEGEISPAPLQKVKWTTYGSSITHCAAAFSPARTWPAIAARMNDVNLTCLGFGGSCHLEPQMAKVIRDTPADIISLKLGINVYGQNTLNERTFMPAVIGMIERIREKHPDTPLGVISPIYSPEREAQPNNVGMTLQLVREWVEESVRRIQQRFGDWNIYYFSGLDIFGPELSEYLPDNLHPDGTGYEILGKNFSQKVFSVLYPEAPE